MSLGCCLCFSLPPTPSMFTFTSLAYDRSYDVAQRRGALYDTPTQPACLIETTNLRLASLFNPSSALPLLRSSNSYDHPHRTALRTHTQTSTTPVPFSHRKDRLTHQQPRLDHSSAPSYSRSCATFIHTTIRTAFSANSTTPVRRAISAK